MRHIVEVATASIGHPPYSQLPQVIPTSSRPLLSSVPAQLPVFMSAPSLIDTPQDTSFIPPPATATTPPDLPPVTTHTFGMKVLYFQISIQFCVPFEEHNFMVHAALSLICMVVGL